MSAIIPKLVMDDTLGIDSQINYAVEKSAMMISHKRQKCDSANANSLKFSISIPSPTTVVDTEFLVETRYTVEYKGIPAAGKYLVSFGESDSIAPFPLHQHCSVLRATINGCSITTNMSQYLDPLLRCMDKEVLKNYACMTPTQLDEVANYSLYKDVPPYAYPNNPFSDYTFDGRGGFKIESISGNELGDNTVEKTVLVTFVTTEPILMSPFHIPGSKNAGFYGVGNIDIEYILGSTNRMVRWIDGAHGLKAKAINSITVSNESYVHYKVLTPNPSDRVLPNVCAQPLMAINPHVTQETSTLATGLTATTITNSVTLSSCPDKIMVFVRDKHSNQNNATADAYLTIDNIKVNFGNNDNLLASASKQQLYVMSKENGLKMNYQQFTGIATKNDKLFAISAGGAWSQVANTAPSSVGANVATTGSIVVLGVARDVTVSESFFAPGSQGQFGLSVSVTYTNNLGYTVQPEIIVCDIQSGVFLTSNRVSTPYYGVLSKDMVLQALEQEPIYNETLYRAIGGAGIFSRLKSFALKHMPTALSFAKQALANNSNHENEKVAKASKIGHSVLDNLGYGGESGGYLTGGESGGAKNKRIAKHLAK